MLLKDKQTGKVDEYRFCQKVGNGDIVGLTVGNDLDNPIFFNSLRELCERFEDALERPFEEVVKPLGDIQIASQLDGESALGVIQIADRDYYEILPDGTKKTKFTWHEAMEIEKKTNGKWRVPTQAEWFAICAAFGRDEDEKITGEMLIKNLNLTTEEGGCGAFWSSSVSGTAHVRYLDFSPTSVYPQNTSNKVFCFTVRCVRGNDEETN